SLYYRNSFNDDTDSMYGLRQAARPYQKETTNHFQLSDLTHSLFCHKYVGIDRFVISFNEVIYPVLG
ncbi:hypothetical protein SNEBB_009654, partial [Seison nebaliae]